MATPSLFSSLWGGGGGGDSGAGTTPAGAGQLISPTGDPTFARLLEAAQAAIPTGPPASESWLQAAQGAIPTNQPSVMDIAAQGASSPLLSAILGPMLQRLQQPQAAQRTQLTEATRATGGLRDSAYTGGMNELLQKQGLQQNDLMAQILKETLGPLLNASMQQQQMSYDPARILSNLAGTAVQQESLAYNPAKMLTDLLGVAKPQYVSPQGAGGAGGGGSGWENIPPSMGLATPMMGSSMPSTGYTSPAAMSAAGQASDWENYYRNLTGGGGTRATAGQPAGGGGGYDPLTQYLLGGQGSSFPIEQSGANSWQSVSYNPLTDYAQTNMEY